jgi:hypothetical protein
MALRATKADEDGPPLWGRRSACGPDFIRSTGPKAGACVFNGAVVASGVSPVLVPAPPAEPAIRPAACALHGLLSELDRCPRSHRRRRLRLTRISLP